MNFHDYRYDDKSGFAYLDSADLSFRGPEIYTKGDYHYHCKVNGEFVWFHGDEEIFYMDEKSSLPAWM